MKKILILGAGVSGHTAASYLQKFVGKKAEVIVMAPNSKWSWIPSNIWVGVGDMKPDQVQFPLAPTYKKAGITFIQAKAEEIWPEGGDGFEKPFVRGVVTSEGSENGEKVEVEYDYLINATGPKLNFGATEGLGIGSQIGEHTYSVCTTHHATDASNKLDELIEKARYFKHDTPKLKILIGTGNAVCTCQGAAMEYIFNVDMKLRKEGLRDRFEITWISNEQVLGDLGMGTLHIQSGGFLTNSKVLIESYFAERNIKWILRAGVNKIEEGLAHYETLDGEFHTQEFDFAMLLPPFTGVDLSVYNKEGEDIKSELFAPNGFTKVDADYTPKPYEEWSANDWPKTYESKYENVFAIGIAFAPPHQISKPMKSPNGTLITPAPPRTGQPSGTMAHAVACTIADRINGKDKPAHTAPMNKMGAACIASTGTGLFRGSALSVAVYPVVPDYEKYPETGRDQSLTFGEVGLAGHWIKYSLHHMFLYKAKMKPFWSVIPD